MRRQLPRALAVAVCLAVMAAGCTEEEVDEAEREAREAATSVVSQAQGQAAAATRLTANLTGMAEVPAGDPDGTGTATVTLQVGSGQVCYEVSVRNVDRPTGMHIHEGKAGENGPIVVPMTTPSESGTPTTGCADVDRALLTRLGAQPGNFYVNLHTNAYQQGAIRGQLSQ